MKRCYGVDLKEQKEKLLTSPVAQKIIQDIVGRADKVLNEEYKALKISDYMLFAETGDRKQFEREYFKRRNNCSFISIAYWLTSDEKYKKPLIDLIFHICDEFTWCLPAHANLEENPDTYFILTHIDLFQAETARLLADIDAILEDKLPRFVRGRMEYEVRLRIMTKKDFWWTNGVTNNWSAVCSGGTGIAYMHFGTKEEIEEVMPALNKGMELFLSGFGEDGCCLEGYSYWAYGFGYFLLYASAVLDYTNGKVNMFENEKVKRIAMFPQRVRLGNTKVVSFSDGGNDFTFSRGIFCLLRKIYGKEVVYPPIEYGTAMGNVYSVRELLWFDTEYAEDKNEFLTSYFEDAQWYIKQSENYSFASKGGKNNEPHNHNDIGSFMIVTKNDDVPLTDLGCGIYRKETFDPKLRYTLLNNGSHGHSVPIINGEHQKAGEYSAKNVTAGDNFFELCLENAYEKGLCNKIKRRFEFDERQISLCDIFEYSEKTETIKERFVTLTKPDITDGSVNLKTAEIMFDKDKYSVSVSEDSYRNHANTEDVKVYLIDFKGKNVNETEFKFQIKIL